MHCAFDFRRRHYSRFATYLCAAQPYFVRSNSVNYGVVHRQVTVLLEQMHDMCADE